jgi:small subunit ribosomal protein S2
MQEKNILSNICSTKLPFFQLLDIGFQLGHRIVDTTHEMRQYLYCSRGNYVIFNLEQTLAYLKRALFFLETVAYSQGKIMFIAHTNLRTIQRMFVTFAKLVNQPCNALTRWEGGILTNWGKLRSMRKARLLDMFKIRTDFGPEKRRLERHRYFLYCQQRNEVGGLNVKCKVVKYYCFPDGVFLFNPSYNYYPVAEISRVRIPMLGIVDSDNPYYLQYTYPIPGNDDGYITIKHILRLCGHAFLKARTRRLVEFYGI